jgi:hypothetical protein
MNLGDKRKGHLKGHLNGRVNSRPIYGLPAKIWWVSVYLSTSLIDTLRAQLAGRAALLTAGHVQWVEDRCLDSGVSPDEGVVGLIFGYVTSETMRTAGPALQQNAAVRRTGACRCHRE